MSWISKLTGIGISPKGVKIDPLRALGTVATIGTLGSAGPLAGIISKIPGAAKVVGASKGITGALGMGGAAAGGAAGTVAQGGGMLDRFRSIGGMLKGGLDLANTANTVYSGYQGAKLRGNMAAQADAQAAENAAARTRGIAGMQAAEQRPDLSRLAVPPDPNRFRRVTVGGVT